MHDFGKSTGEKNWNLPEKAKAAEPDVAEAAAEVLQEEGEQAAAEAAEAPADPEATHSSKATLDFPHRLA